jgi:hypothetical protein
MVPTFFDCLIQDVYELIAGTRSCLADLYSTARNSWPGALGPDLPAYGISVIPVDGCKMGRQKSTVQYNAASCQLLRLNSTLIVVGVCLITDLVIKQTVYVE